jgi:hypothetical protein
VWKKSQNTNPAVVRHQPTAADRLKVSRRANMGIPQTDIAKVFGMAPETLRKLWALKIW